jgi:hypothetical protein
MSYDGPYIARRSLPTKLAAVLRRCCRGAALRVRAVTFWLAVGLPWLLLALTVGGYVTVNPGAFAGLFAVTTLCAVLGRNHRR